MEKTGHFDGEDPRGADLDEGRVNAEREALEAEGADKETLRRIIANPGDGVAERVEAARRLLGEYLENQIGGNGASVVEQAERWLKNAA